MPPTGKKTCWPGARSANTIWPRQDGWLTLVGLDWLKTGVSTFGAADDNQIQIHAQIPAHLGMFTVSGGAAAGKARAGKSKAPLPAVAETGAIVQLLSPREGFPLASRWTAHRHAKALSTWTAPSPPRSPGKA